MKYYSFWSSFASVSLLFFGLMLLSASSSSKNKNYTYIDGSNNEYQISHDSILYIPVKPIESSSGTYSGGESKSVKITSEQFSKIESIIQQIVKDKKNYLDTRPMGCGTLLIGKKSLFFSGESPYKADLETELKSCLNR